MTTAFSTVAIESYWPFDEASGNALDIVGGNTLADQNTVGSSTGLVYPTAREFVAVNSESFTIANNASLDVSGGSFSFALWNRPATLITDRVILRKYQAASPGTFDYSFRTNVGTGKYRFSVVGSGSTNLDATSFTPAVDTWDLTIVWYDAVAQTLNIQSNNGTVDSTAHTFGVGNVADTFLIGGYASNFWEGRLGPVMFAKGVWTAAERARIYTGYPSYYGLKYGFPSGLHLPNQRVFVRDTFTGAVDTLLTVHAGEIGATWSVQPGSSGWGGALTGGGGVYQSTGANTFGQLITSGVPPSANYSVRATLTQASAISSEKWQIQGRSSASQYDAYVLSYTADSLIHLHRVVNGSFTELGGTGVSFVPTVGVSYIFELVLGNGSQKVYQDGVLKIEGADTVITAAGFAGLGGFSPSAGSATTGWQFSNFLAESLDPVPFVPRTFAGRKRRAGHSVSSPGGYF